MSVSLACTAQLQQRNPVVSSAGAEIPVPKTAPHLLKNSAEHADTSGAEYADIPGTVSEETAVSTAEAQQKIDAARKLCEEAQEFREQGKRDDALDALDMAFLMILKADSDDNLDILEQKEKIRVLISKRILEIYASAKTATRGNHDAIPIPMNKYVKKEIEYLSKGRFLPEAFKRAGRYLPFIQEELRKAGLPGELAWLPLIESGYNVKALSPARALGLWQFIPSTGYKFGLNRDKYVDERLDPEKSTKAAIAYLKELHNMFGDWATVLAAYNCGEGRVLKIIRSQNVNYLDNFWDLYEKLPRETARYVPRFLATLYMIQHPEEYGLHNIQADSPLEFEEVRTEKQLTLQDVAKITDISERELQALNPELKRKLTPPRTYALRIPKGKSEVLLAKLDSIPASSLPVQSSPSPAGIVYHRIKKGDTLSEIARRYGAGTKEIMRANKMRRSHYLVAGNILKIPGRNSGQTVISKQSKSRRTSVSTYTVRRGDSLWDIARTYGVSTKDIRRINRLRHSKLSIGQELIIPAGSKGKKRLRVYKVRNGDIPMEIARRHNMSLNDFLKANRMTQQSKIYPGQKVYVE